MLLKNTEPEKKMKVKLLGLLLVFAGVLYWQDSTSDDAMDKYIEEYKAFQAKADSVTELADSLKAEIVIADNESRAAESRAKILGRQVNSLKNETLSMEERAEVMKETLLDTLELARQVLPLKDSIIAKQKETIAAQDGQVTELQSALQSKDNALRMAMMRGDSLQAVINLIPPAPKNPNRMFGFKLPSRKASFAIGLAMGIGAGVLVIK
jgi:membrane-associated HD superfamily phosphohydrolase